MTHKEYNGWTNYETWAANLWLTNDDGTDSLCREMAADEYQNAEAEDYKERREEATQPLAEALKAMIEENSPEVTGLYADLLNAALSEIDWYEIAEHFLEDVGEEVE